jgi:hypothetical protein
VNYCIISPPASQRGGSQRLFKSQFPNPKSEIRNLQARSLSMTSLAPAPRTPSARNQQIHAAVKIRGCRQADVAREHRITQSRVSRIVAQVEAWRGAAPAASDVLKTAERRRHERWLARQRYEELYQRSLQELDSSNRTLTTERSGSRDGKEFKETTRREQARSVQWAKTAIRAAENLLRLAELEPLPPPPTADDVAELQFAEVATWIIRMRLEAERAGEVPKSGNAHALVRKTLNDLLRQQDDPPPARPPHPHPLGAGRGEHSTSHTTHHSPLTPDSAACHIRHKPNSNIPPTSASSPAEAVASTPTDSSTYDSPEPFRSPSSSAATAQKNVPHRTPQREPWEDEYEALKRKPKTIKLVGGAVTR